MYLVENILSSKRTENEQEALSRKCFQYPKLHYSMAASEHTMVCVTGNNLQDTNDRKDGVQDDTDIKTHSPVIF